MRKILQPVRFLAVLALSFVFLSHMAIVYLLRRQRWPRTRLSNVILSRYSCLGLWLLGVKVRTLGIHHRDSQPNGLYVGNHLSYLDVLVISSVLPAGFVTSREIRETPFLGLICEMAGSLFVERRSRANLLGEVAELTEGLKNGLNIAIFPEATSTNGAKILRFKRPLYLAGVQAGANIIPFCLNYRTVGGKPLTTVTRDWVFWYGDMDFAPHLWALAGSGGVMVELQFLEPLRPGQRPEDAGELSQLTQQAIEKVFSPIT